MLPRSKLILAALTVAIALTTGVGAASANRLSVNEKRFVIDWITRAEFPEETKLSFIAAGRTVRCTVRLAGNFSSEVITKSAGTTIGSITGATIGECEGGTAAPFNETLPWRVVYVSFTGTLPAITGVTVSLVGVRVRVTPTGLPECNATTTAANPANGIFNVQATTPRSIRSLRSDETKAIPLEGGFACTLAGSGTLSGLALVWNAARTALVSMTLI
ncbi:MAG TPA: hypothetical protein VFF79_16480 [Conexibacter sp.]|jgi:hypothetical protein|nr:hypothetical protein [Conexibacter sp.]